MSSPKDKADAFAQQFAANSTLDDNGRSPPDFPLRTPTSIKLPVITPRKVVGIIVNLDINKASGPDRILVVVLKKCCPEISSILSRLFNFYLAESIFPSSWKLAHVVSVFKSAGDKSQPSNYMPISLISVVGKVFECFLNQSLLEYLESNNLLSDAQYGFRRSVVTSNAPVTLCRIRQTHEKRMSIFGIRRYPLKCVSCPFYPLDGRSSSGDVRQSGQKTLCMHKTKFRQKRIARSGPCPMVVRFVLDVYCTWSFSTRFHPLGVLQGPLLQEMGRMERACTAHQTHTHRIATGRLQDACRTTTGQNACSYGWQTDRTAVTDDYSISTAHPQYMHRTWNWCLTKCNGLQLTPARAYKKVVGPRPSDLMPLCRDELQPGSMYVSCVTHLFLVRFVLWACGACSFLMRLRTFHCPVYNRPRCVVCAFYSAPGPCMYAPTKWKFTRCPPDWRFDQRINKIPSVSCT